MRRIDACLYIYADPVVRLEDLNGCIYWSWGTECSTPHMATFKGAVCVRQAIIYCNKLDESIGIL